LPPRRVEPIVLAAQDGVVVVAPDRDCARPPQEVDYFIRAGAIADEIARVENDPDSLLLDLGQYSFKGLKIAMYVGNQSNPQEEAPAILEKSSENIGDL
jgi:hypothetical protein